MMDGFRIEPRFRLRMPPGNRKPPALDAGKFHITRYKLVGDHFEMVGQGNEVSGGVGQGRAIRSINVIEEDADIVRACDVDEADVGVSVRGNVEIGHVMSLHGGGESVTVAEGGAATNPVLNSRDRTAGGPN